MPTYPTYKLGDVAEIINGKSQKEVVSSQGKYPIYGSGGIIGWATGYLCKENSTIVGRKGTIDSPIFVNQKFWNIDTAFGIHPSERILPRYLFFFCKSFDFRSLDKSTTMPSLTKRDLLKIPIPLPPLPTQHAIVSRIESLFAELDKAEEHLRTAQQQLKTYRQAVLNHWLNNDDGKWEMVKLGEVIEVKDGTHDTPKYVQSGIPFVTQKNITESGISFSNVQYITEQDHLKFHERSNVAQNDILIAMIGANRGNATIVNTDTIFSIKNVGLLKYAPNVFNNKFLLFYLRSQEAINYIKRQSKGGAQEFIGLKELRNFPITFPPLSEQQRIVKEIESRLSQTEATEARIAESLQQTEALRQSILKKAFSGELV